MHYGSSMANTSTSGTIRWPAHYAPENAPVHVRNELDMDAAPEVVWAYVRIRSGTAPDLSPDAAFRWTTFGVRLESRVLEFVPNERIAWDARGVGVDAYHAWLIHKTPTGSHVLTEETQHGWLARLGALVMPRRMHYYHQIWLEQLRERARTGFPA
jgi:hypothetical protein